MAGFPGQARNEAHAADRAPLVAHVFPTFAVGGAQVRFAALANRFGPEFRHIVVALDGNLACQERLQPGLQVSFPDVGASKNALLRNAWRFRRMIREWAPDVLVTCNWGAIEFALGNIVPVTRHLHVVDGFGPEERDTEIPRRIRLRRLALSRSPVVLPSRNLVRIASEVWKLPRSVIRYVPNGVDLGRFATDGAERGGAAPVIGTVAALREEKNLGRLLRSFARIPVGRLIVVGEGADGGVLRALAGSLGIAGRVEFAGHQADPAPFYRRFDIFALSSDTEQMPLSLMEAMASGLPAVATDVGDVRLMLARENAAYVTPLDDGAFTTALAALVNDPALRRRVGAANRARAELDFDEKAMFARYEALWRGTAGIL